MADLYMRTCMRCGTHTDCLAYEDGFICYPDCWGGEQEQLDEDQTMTDMIFKPGDLVVTRFLSGAYQVLKSEHDSDGREWTTVQTPRGNREWSAHELRPYVPTIHDGVLEKRML